MWDWLKGSSYQPTKVFESGASHHKIKTEINGVSYPCCSTGWTYNSNLETAAISHVRPSSIRLNNPAAHGCCLLLFMLQYSQACADISLVSIYCLFCRCLARRDCIQPLAEVFFIKAHTCRPADRCLRFWLITVEKRARRQKQLMNKTCTGPYISHSIIIYKINMVASVFHS